MFPFPAGAEKVTLFPIQNVVGPFAVTAALGTGLYETKVLGDVALHPFEPTVTE